MICVGLGLGLGGKGEGMEELLDAEPSERRVSREFCVSVVRARVDARYQVSGEWGA